MKWLVYFLESDYDLTPLKVFKKEDARQFLIRREALRAIAVHTCPDIYHLRSNTFSFLLIICDDLQEWDRPTFRDMREQQKVATSVEIGKFTTRVVDGGITYTFATKDDFTTDVERRFKRIFRRLHKILRSALDMVERKFIFTWTITVAVESTTHKYPIAFVNDQQGARLTFDGEPIEDDWLYDSDMLTLQQRFLKKIGGSGA